MFEDPSRPPSPDFLASMGAALAPAAAPPSSVTIPGAVQQALKLKGNAGPGGGGLRNIAGYIGDALLMMSGHQPLYAPMVNQRRQAAQDEQQYERRLTLQREYEQNKPYHVADNDGNIVQINPADGSSRVVYHGAPHLTGIEAEIDGLRKAGATPEQIQAYVANKVDPVHTQLGTDGQGNITLQPFTSSQIRGMAGGNQGPPRVLSTLPPGAVPVSQGGPSPQGSGTFPRRRVP